MSARATEPTIFSTLTPDSLIRFKYSGGSTPGRIRTVRFVSWFWAWGERKGHGEGYMQAYDLNGVYKTYLYSKMSKIGCALIPPSRSNYETQEESISDSEQNSISNWTSWIKQGDIIEFTYMDQTYVRNVKFVKFMNRNCTPKRKILCYEDLQHGGYTKTFFIDKMTVYKTYENKNSVFSPKTVHNEIKNLESKEDILIKQLKNHIDSQNKLIEKYKTKCSQLQEECFNLEDQKIEAYRIMEIHKMRYPTTWESDFVPKKPWTRQS